jgi:hypothetical protein
VDHPGSAVDGLRRGKHLIRNGRSEDGAGSGCVEHSLPDEAAVQGLVAGAAARDQSDLSFDRRILPQDELVLEVDPHEVGMCSPEAGKRLPHDVVGGVDELLHRGLSNAHSVLLTSSPRTRRRGRAR